MLVRELFDELSKQKYNPKIIHALFFGCTEYSVNKDINAFKPSILNHYNLDELKQISRHLQKITFAKSYYAHGHAARLRNFYKDEIKQYIDSRQQDNAQQMPDVPSQLTNNSNPLPDNNNVVKLDTNTKLLLDNLYSAIENGDIPTVTQFLEFNTVRNNINGNRDHNNKLCLIIGNAILRNSDQALRQILNCIFQENVCLITDLKIRIDTISHILLSFPSISDCLLHYIEWYITADVPNTTTTLDKIKCALVSGSNDILQKIMDIKIDGKPALEWYFATTNNNALEITDRFQCIANSALPPLTKIYLIKKYLHLFSEENALDAIQRVQFTDQNIKDELLDLIIPKALHYFYVCIEKGDAAATIKLSKLLPNDIFIDPLIAYEHNQKILQLVQTIIEKPSSPTNNLYLIFKEKKSIFTNNDVFFEAMSLIITKDPSHHDAIKSCLVKYFEYISHHRDRNTLIATISTIHENSKDILAPFIPPKYMQWFSKYQFSKEPQTLVGDAFQSESFYESSLGQFSPAQTNSTATDWQQNNNNFGPNKI